MSASHAFAAVTDVPVPTNEPVHEYAPGTPERSSLVTELNAMNAAGPIDLPHVIAGKHSMGNGERIDVVQPHRHSAVLGTLTNAGHAEASAAVDAADRGQAGMGRDAIRRARRGLPARRRASRRAVAGQARRGHDARPVQDGLSG